MKEQYKVYLAATFDRGPEMCGYADELKRMGHEVTSRWMKGHHTIVAGEDRHNNRMAMEDVEDVKAADVLVVFADPPGALSTSLGGRQVETGIALDNCDRIILVGGRENIFHYLYKVEVFETWEEVKKAVF
jgi:hypothetical protein